MCSKKHIEELEQIKEIKEMADIIHEGDCPLVVLFYNDSLTLAENLYNAGYRKKSDVAREIFEEIEKYSEVALMNGHIETPILCIGFGVLAELKKKYESEGEG